MSKVIWKKVSGFGGLYRVSNTGVVKKIPYLRGNRWGGLTQVKENILKEKLDEDGYKRVCLINGKERKDFFVHRLVAQTFIDNPKNKPCVNHIDSVRDNNNLSNLEWVTHKENVWHGINFGHDTRKGEGNGNSKLKELRVFRIKRLIKGNPEKYTRKYISKTFGINIGTVNNIAKNRTWRHVIV